MHKITSDQLQAIANYLGRLPFADVEPLILMIRQVASTDATDEAPAELPAPEKKES